MTLYNVVRERYREQDSNLHTLRHLILSQACLPIPPPRRFADGKLPCRTKKTSGEVTEIQGVKGLIARAFH
jgi:hypothetical protein